jgi:iron(III) transport system permease protein
MPTVLDIMIYLFVYWLKTTLASVAVLNMDDAGNIAPAASMGMVVLRYVLGRTQGWRQR